MRWLALVSFVFGMWLGAAPAEAAPNCPTDAECSVTQAIPWTIITGGIGSSASPSSSAQAACDAQVAAINAYNTANKSNQGGSPPTYVWRTYGTCTNPVTYQTTGIRFTVTGNQDNCSGPNAAAWGCPVAVGDVFADAFPGSPVCPANASGSPCKCEAGYAPNQAGDQCLQTCSANVTASTGYYPISGQNSPPVLLGCSGTCEVVFDGVAPAGSALVEGVKQWFAHGSYITTGNACESSTTAPDAAGAMPADGCAANQVQGEVNGQMVCVNRISEEAEGEKGDTQVQSKTEKTVTDNGDGTTTTREKTESTWSLPGGGFGSSTRTVETTCDGAGNCSTTETIEGDTPPTDEETSDACEENPDRVGCKELGGTPEADPIEGWTVPLGITPKSGFEHDTSCPADKVLTLSAVTLTVPFGLLCTAADYARPIVIAVAWLSAIGGFMGLSRRG